MRQSKRKRAAAVLFAVIMAVSSSMTAFAAGWRQDGIGWWYEREDGTYPVNTWYEDSDGSWYFFNEAGYMIHDCYRYVDGSIYAFGASGRWDGTMLSEIIPGIWAGKQYVNEWSGFHINVPAGYEIQTADPGESSGAFDALHQFSITIPDGTGSGISLEYDDTSDFSGAESTTPEYVVSLYSVALALYGFTIEGVDNVTLGGKTYCKLSSNGGGVIKMDVYCRKVGRYIECLKTYYWLASEPAVKAVLANIY